MLFNIASALVALGSLTSLTSATVMHIVTVGKDGQLAFCPESITAASGDLVQFQFYPKNHSVVQGFFAKGCTPISEAPAGVAQQGSFSGFMPVSNTSNSGTIPTFTITVNGTGPEWFYCAQAKHCQSGMTFAINPTVEKSVAGYKANCANATVNIVPGQDVPPPAAAASSIAVASSPAASSPAESSPAESPEASGTTPPQAAPTIISLSSITAAAGSGQTALPINSLASSTISRTAGWAVLGLAGCLTIGMLL